MDIRSAVSNIAYYTQGLLEAAKNSDEGREITWVIVESDDDCEVYGKFLLNDEYVKLRDSGCKEFGKNGKETIRKGWERVERLVKAYSDTLTIIGIRDRDYTPFVTGRAATPNVFMTDCRDLEMMMIRSGVLDRFVPHVVREHSLADILDSVYAHTRVLGYMRIMSDVYGLTCSFHDFHKMSLMWNQTSHSYLADWRTNLTYCFIANSKVAVTEQQFDDFVAGRNLEACSEYDVCRGHDVVEHLSWNLVKKEYSKKNLSKRMKDNYTMADFQGTRLCASLKSWEQRSQKRVLETREPVSE